MWEYLFDVKWKKIAETAINCHIWPHCFFTNYVSLMMVPDVVKQPSQNLHLWGLVPEKEKKIRLLFHLFIQRKDNKIRHLWGLVPAEKLRLPFWFVYTVGTCSMATQIPETCCTT